MFLGDDYGLYTNLSDERKSDLLNWIHNNLLPIQTFNARHTSYGLKHLVKLGEGKDSYFTNGEFKGAMLQAGYRVRNMREQNWIFNVSQRSPVFLASKHPR